MKWRIGMSLLLVLIAVFFVFSWFGRKVSIPATSSEAFEQRRVPRGVWVTVFSSRKVLYSKTAVADLIDYCNKNKIDEIYLQIYRSGGAYYDSQIAGKESYTEMLKAFGSDPIDYLLSEGARNHLKVYAWVNILSLAQNHKAPIIKKYGTDILTHDRNGRASIRTDGVDRSDQYYLRDDQIFLEPGDKRVVDWTLSIIQEVLLRYPAFSGIHLDYIRYPYPVPFIPDSRFTDFGVSYGYGDQNVARFKESSGLNPLKDDMYKNDLHLKWDDWKRDQVTAIVDKVSAFVRQNAREWKISCAVVPTMERAYLIAYQDWPMWLEKGLVDYVVLMNYTKDERFAIESVKGGMAYRGHGKVYAGLGAFLYKDAKDIVRINSAILHQDPDGVVIFSYDDLVNLGVTFVD